MTQVGHEFHVSEDLELGGRIRLARIAAKLDADFVAAKLGISRRSLDRTEAGSRRPSRAELIVFAELAGQDVSFFGITSGSSQASLPSPLPGVNLGDESDVA